MRIYIKSSDCISSQQSFQNSIPINIADNQEALFASCIKPDYKKYVSPKLLRRMSPIIRNGVTCSLSVLQKIELEHPDAIIVGTALGCLKDTCSFLTQLIEENEQLPNPTHFIQSTHNTIAGQIALLLSCTSYNFTFSQNHNSFETALLDAQLMIFEKQAKNVLVGGVDEMNDTVYELIKDLSCYKNIKLGEGTAFFVLSTEENFVELKGIRIVNGIVIDFNSELFEFGLEPNDIDLVIGGDNSIEDNNYIDFQKCFSEKPYVWYKPFVGEFGTVSAIACWLGVKIIEEQEVPNCWIKNKIGVGKINNVLIYNNVNGEHSLMLLSLNK